MTPVWGASSSFRNSCFNTSVENTVLFSMFSASCFHFLYPDTFFILIFNVRATHYSPLHRFGVSLFSTTSYRNPSTPTLLDFLLIMLAPVLLFSAGQKLLDRAFISFSSVAFRAGAISRITRAKSHATQVLLNLLRIPALLMHFSAESPI